METNERQPMTGKLHTASAVDQMAADWVARAELRTLTSEEEAELEVWLERDPRHLGAYAKARAVALHCEEAAMLRVAGGDPLRKQGMTGLKRPFPPASRGAGCWLLEEGAGSVSGRRRVCLDEPGDPRLDIAGRNQPAAFARWVGCHAQHRH
jgi:ferric-dicitrate binding protein FerR (iron transport regulator)